MNIDPEILSGTPLFNATRVPVKNLFDFIETGENIEIFLIASASLKKTVN